MLRWSSSVKLFAAFITKMNAWGPGEVIPIHLDISCCVTSFGVAVSMIPGVSTMRIFLLNLTAAIAEQTRVPETDTNASFDPRMEFPVALLPDAFFPRRTNLISSYFVYPRLGAPYVKNTKKDMYLLYNKIRKHEDQLKHFFSLAPDF